MSISNSLHTAYSGLVAVSRRGEAISQNVANALSDGFGRREVRMSALSLGGQGAGVRVVSVSRETNDVAIADRRLAMAEADGRDTLATAQARLERVIGTPGAGDSLSDRVSLLSQTLAEAASRPESGVRQQRLASAAADLAARINAIGEASQDVRMQADGSIGDIVDRLNSTLGDIAQLNRDIRVMTATGRNANGLKDQRQALVDEIAGLVPVRTYQREFDGIAIVSAGGAVLLDGKPSQFGFQRSGLIEAGMSLASGALSGLTLNGRAMKIGAGEGLLEGGQLAAEFALRDSVAPFISDQADALARNLIERFTDPAVDTTLAPGAPGLFTDAGAAFDPANEKGIAARIAVNALVDPAQGGDLWRLRDGLGAAQPGLAADSALFNRMTDALGQLIQPASGGFGPAATGFAALADSLAAMSATQRLDAESAFSFSRARFEELRAVEAENGVDTDQEMQKLLLVERAYAANARVITAADEMLKTLMEI